jgi:hypothetical protein
MGVFFSWVFFHLVRITRLLPLFLDFLRLGFLRAPGIGRRNMGALILESPMPRRRERKCRYCGQLYEVDPRNRYHQRYCSQLACRQVSKASSQHRWLASPKGRDYFRGSANVLRVQAWRKAHPGYWRTRRKRSGALQDHCLGQTLVPPADKGALTLGALQDVCVTQGFALQAYRPVNRQRVTRQHRRGHPQADTLGPAESGPRKPETKTWP